MSLTAIEGGKAGRDWRTAPFGERILELYARVHYMQKGGTNKHFKYKFLQESELKDRLNEAMRDLFIIIGKLEVTPIGVVTPQSAVVSVSLVLMDVNAKDTDTALHGVVLQGIGGGVDSSDKAPMKAVVAAMKYALMNGLAIKTGDDPEASDSEGAAYEQLRANIEDAATTSALNLLNPDVSRWKDSPREFGQLKDAFKARLQTLQGGGSEMKEQK
jgi:hypothetical protein